MRSLDQNVLRSAPRPHCACWQVERDSRSQSAETWRFMLHQDQAHSYTFTGVVVEDVHKQTLKLKFQFRALPVGPSQACWLLHIDLSHYQSFLSSSTSLFVPFLLMMSISTASPCIGITNNICKPRKGFKLCGIHNRVYTNRVDISFTRSNKSIFDQVHSLILWQ